VLKPMEKEQKPKEDVLKPMEKELKTNRERVEADEERVEADRGRVEADGETDKAASSGVGDLPPLPSPWRALLGPWRAWRRARGGGVPLCSWVAPPMAWPRCVTGPCRGVQAAFEPSYCLSELLRSTVRGAKMEGPGCCPHVSRQLHANRVERV
jgi:hypothetical protein